MAGFTNNSEKRLAIGKTNKTVGKAIIQEIPQEVNHGEITCIPIPSDLTVLINATIPDIIKERKKGTRKIIARVGSLGIPKK